LEGFAKAVWALEFGIQKIQCVVCHGQVAQSFQETGGRVHVEWEFMDGSYVKAHQHSAGAATVEPQGIGKSRAGNTARVCVRVARTAFTSS